MRREDDSLPAADRGTRVPRTGPVETGTVIVSEGDASTRRVNRIMYAHMSTDIFAGFISGGAVIAALFYMQQSLGLSLFITSWASSTALILSAPRDDSVAPATVFIAHTLCAAVGGILLLIGPHAILLPAVAFGAAYAAMQQSGRMHPPAAANVVIPLLAPILWNQWLAAVAAGTAFLTALAWCVGAARGRS